MSGNREALDQYGYRRIAIETTGLADPAPILHTLLVDPAVASDHRLEGVITTIDAVNGRATLEAHAEAVKQAALADRIPLTKRDLASPETSRPVTRSLRY